jgi:hypothetical protein
LYASAAERDALFGYDKQNLPRVQRNYNASYKWNHLASPESQDIGQAPRNFYFNTSTNPSEKSVIGYLGMRPNLYNDNFVTWNKAVPDFYRTWQPLTTTANPVPTGMHVQYIPHTPVEIAPRQRENYWVADLNARIYERSLLSSAVENPYANWYARQAFINLIAQDMRLTSDPYLQPINGPDQTLASRLMKGDIPAVTNI